MKTFIGQSMATNPVFTASRSESPANKIEQPAPFEFDPAAESSLIPDSFKIKDEQGTHIVSAIYPNKLEAEVVRQRLIDRGIIPRQIDILENILAAEKTTSESDEVFKNVIIDGAIGTVVGAGLGAVGTIAVVATNITLFIASPFLAPLTMLGWFAGLGGLVGAAVGATQKPGKFSELIADAIKSGNVVLMVLTQSETDRHTASEVISSSLKGRDIEPAESISHD